MPGSTGMGGAGSRKGGKWWGHRHQGGMVWGQGAMVRLLDFPDACPPTACPLPMLSLSLQWGVTNLRQPSDNYILYRENYNKVTHFPCVESIYWGGSS